MILHRIGLGGELNDVNALFYSVRYRKYVVELIIS